MVHLRLRRQAFENAPVAWNVFEGMAAIYPSCRGPDVHKRTVVACLLTTLSDGERATARANPARSAATYSLASDDPSCE